MPTYEYKCPQCGTQKEVVRKITDDSPELCDEQVNCLEFAPRSNLCNTPMVRQISRTSFALKGSGWARDGYK